MIDIETLGTAVGAVIVSVGAVGFDRGGLGDTFVRSISLESCQDAGLSVDADTLEWWLGQEAPAREQLVGGDDLAVVLRDFTEWYLEHEFEEIWANSPSFDCELLEHAYEAVGQVEPWEFYAERDVRTIRSLPLEIDLEQTGTEHDALADAKHQAREVGLALQRLADCGAFGRAGYESAGDRDGLGENDDAVELDDGDGTDTTAEDDDTNSDDDLEGGGTVL